MQINLDQTISYSDADKVLANLLRHYNDPAGMVYALEEIDYSAKSLVSVYRVAFSHFCVFSAPLGLHECGGKGLSGKQAQISGLAEAVERVCLELPQGSKTIEACYQDLKDQAVFPNDCMLYSEKQYRDAAPAGLKKLDWETPIAWTQTIHLPSGKKTYFATEQCYFLLPHMRQYFARADSNGCAAGSSLEEAFWNAFWELIERDTLSLWWFNRYRCARAILQTPFLKELEIYHKTIQRDFWLLQLPNDWNLPVYAAVSCDQHGRQIALGFGADMQPDLAMQKAATELMQVYSTIEKNDYGKNAAISDWLKVNIQNCDWLKPLDAAQSPVIKKPLTNLRDCIELLQQKGLNAYALDLTQKDMGVFVGKLFVPGLRHMLARLAPGRLYEIPTKLGLIDGIKTEEQLNPQPIVYY